MRGCARVRWENACADRTAGGVTTRVNQSQSRYRKNVEKGGEGGREGAKETDAKMKRKREIWETRQGPAEQENGSLSRHTPTHQYAHPRPSPHPPPKTLYIVYVSKTPVTFFRHVFWRACRPAWARPSSSWPSAVVATSRSCPPLLPSTDAPRDRTGRCRSCRTSKPGSPGQTQHGFTELIVRSMGC